MSVKIHRQSHNVGSSRGAALAGAALLGAIAIAYPVWRGLVAPTQEVDFRYYWFAGYMWAHGLDPYSADFARLGNAVLPPGAELRVWFYPPNWWVISRGLALLDFSSALTAWRALVTVILLGATSSVAALLGRGLPMPQRRLFTAGACALAAIVEPTGDVLTGGQVSPILIYAGMALIICGIVTSGAAALAMGLVLVFLKPQIGFVMLLPFAIAPRHRLALACAIIATLLLCLPQFISYGLVHTASEVIANIGGWSDNPSNTPLTTTGPLHLLARLGLTLPLWISLACAVVSALAAGVMLRRNPASLEALAVVMAGVAAFVPLHNYDMTILVLIAALLVALNASTMSRLLVGGALLLALRPIRVEAFLEVPTYAGTSGGNILYSAASLVLLALAVGGALRNRGRTRAPTGMRLSAAVTGRSTNR